MLTSNRTTNILLIVMIAVGIGIAAMLATGALGGPLDPPAPPASTDSVKLPGTPISGPTIISQPGHYYLTNDITVTGAENAIAITSSRVSLDLGGFHILGGGGQNSVGIGVSTSVSDVQIRNGSVRGFYIGIDAKLASASVIENVTVMYGTARGIVLGGVSRLENCIVGFSGEGVVIESGNSTISHCHIVGNNLNGVFFIGYDNVLQDSTLDINGIAGGNASSVRVFDTGNIVRRNTFQQPFLDMYITATDTLVQDNSSVCPFTVKDATGGTTYVNNTCQSVVP